MKVVYGWILIFLAACQPETPSQTGGVIPGQEVVAEYFSVFNRHDWSGLAGFYADSVILKDPVLGTGPVTVSRQDIVKKYQDLHQSIPDVKDSVVAVYPAGSVVTVEFISTGTGPDGKPFTLPICTIFEFKAGKIIRDLTYYDNF